MDSDDLRILFDLIYDNIINTDTSKEEIEQLIAARKESERQQELNRRMAQIDEETQIAEASLIAAKIEDEINSDK